ncbi:ABC transporter substrate-binding protein [Candidatus Thiodictyon syntrophicum]|jgi:ABC-type nitrate/sulfonate/bicarbonate transport system substrate-binding protein|uniref:SsuA/THI5-like domain-containing protein n=1 Tax=Candidatus Thiodictyon syntrophicum TaxID=1166950 RepID=A0A2K8U7Z2_9GAMM|nr:NrtA/SsuA/CpmA family ABC transporter substrate-binding protein [Candidatus Thiodictyon syntrophicum]AUB81706.1 hypothetical protein THSYN_12545 [Candidatus Thiodictyon syntrophicum]
MSTYFPNDASWPRLRRTLALALALALSVAPTQSSAAAPLVICYGSPASALVPLAGLRNFYAAEGLEVQTRLYPSGFQALQAMMAGDCTLATAAVPPVVYQALRRGDFRILAQISSGGDADRIVARRDHCIGAPADLRGHRIAVPQATSAHYFLDMFLAAQGLTPADLTQVYLPAQEVGPALLAGTVDAAALWEPNIRNLATTLGDQAQVFTFSGLVVSPFLLLAPQAFARQEPGAIQGVLRALVRAERSLVEAPVAAVRLLAPPYGVSFEEFDFMRSDSCWRGPPSAASRWRGPCWSRSRTCASRRGAWRAASTRRWS